MLFFVLHRRGGGSVGRRMHNDGISVVGIRERYSSRLGAATSALEG